MLIFSNRTVRKMKEFGLRRNDREASSSTIMESLGYGDVSERKNVGHFLDRRVSRGVARVHFGHSLEFTTDSHYFPSYQLWQLVLTPVRFSENSSRGMVSWLSETRKKTSSIRPKITR
jgi:hypothetical protein